MMQPTQQTQDLGGTEIIQFKENLEHNTRSTYTWLGDINIHLLKNTANMMQQTQHTQDVGGTEITQV